MKKKYYCARCRKELTNYDVYASDIDYALICNDCFKKEQPKALAKQLNELQSKYDKQQTLLNIYKDEELKIAKLLDDEHLTLIDSRNVLENKILKEFVDKLDEEFGKNVEPTLSERADNIIALHRSNKKYCEIADEKIKDLQSQLDQQKAMWNELKEWVKLQIDGLNEQLTDYDFDSDCRELSIENFEIMLQQMQELEGEDE